MMSTGLKALLFAGGVVTAAAGTAYLTGALDPWLDRKPPVVAALPETPVPPAAGEAEAPSSEALPAPEEPAAAEAPTASVPGFDLLRVEPDGSVVIAGQAMPGAAVEAVTGGAVLGGAQANEDGDFVILLDEPLAPGDYQIVLQATQPDGAVTPSVQTAVVSIPDKDDDQVLALVEEPGEPAQLVVVPQAPDDEAEIAATPEAEAEPEAMMVAEAPAEAGIAEEEPAAPEVETVLAEPEVPAEPEVQAEPEVEMAQTGPDAPAAEAEPAPAVAEVAEPAAPQEEVPLPAATPTVTVEAVEIEAGTVFVAGAADPGHTVRVYANDILLGDAPVSDAGRFLVETQRDLPVGDYIIRADLLAADGAVLARAAVPFEREPGVSIAAVAPEAPASEPVPQPEEVAGIAEPAPEIAAEDEAALPPEPVMIAEADESEVTAPKLERVGGAVIIRRGDNLWRISRRVYGKGVRYSSIYLANQDQIQDPDRIWPGQVFTLPSQAAEGEPANLDAIADQIMAPATEEGAVPQ